MKPLWPLIGALSVSVGVATAQEGQDIDALARDLANPGAANATLNFKLEYRSFGGDLPGATDQNSTTLTFQPVFPFILQNDNNLIFRPSVSFVWDRPAFDASTGRFDTVNAWGDIPFDLLYSWRGDAWTLGAGVVGNIPTDSAASSENWLFGPSFLAVKTFDWGVVGLFPFHNEKIGGSGPDTSITSLQYFAFYGLGNGWQIGTGPTITYDWEADSDQAWTVPIQLALAKTTAIGNQVIKMNLSIERNVVRPDAFAEEWTTTFTFSPVISNPFQPNPPAPLDTATRNELLKPIRDLRAY